MSTVVLPNSVSRSLSRRVIIYSLTSQNNIYEVLYGPDVTDIIRTSGRLLEKREVNNLVYSKLFLYFH